MKKQLRTVGCFISIFVIILLTACRDASSVNSVNSDKQSSSLSRSESLQTDNTGLETDSIAPNNHNTAQIENSDTHSTTSSEKSNASVNSEIETDTVTDTSASETSSATSTKASVHIHSYSSKKIAPTCTTEGYTLNTCGCGHSEKISKVSPLGHSWSNWTTVKDATATSTGLQQRTCTRCGATSEQVLAKLPQSESDIYSEILRLVNEERAKQGLNALQYYSAGQSAADVRANEIKTVFQHTRPNGTSCFTALDEAGIEYRGAGENIANGYSTAQAVMEGWMNSEGHRNNILNASFTHIIVGINGNYWVQLFMTI